MKFKKLAVYSSLLLSTATLITIIHNQKYSSARFGEQQETVTSLENEDALLHHQDLRLQVKLESVMKKILKESEQNNMSLSIDTEKISIFGKSGENTTEFSDEFYSNLNQLMNLANIKDIGLYYIGNEIDFSKVNLSTIKNLHLYECKEDLDCTFFTQKYDSISFSAVPTQLAINVVKNCDCIDTIISCSNIKDELNEREQTFIDINEFANYLVENNVCMKELSVSQWSYCMDNDFLSEETIDTLCHVSTERLSITSEGSTDIINLDLTLNKDIDEFHIALPSYINSWTDGIGMRQFGNIKIRSENPNLNIIFEYGYLDHQTYFQLPTSSTVQLIDIGHNDISPLYHLSNVKSLEYKTRFDPVLCTSLYTDGFTIAYNADTDNFNDFMDEFKEKMDEYWSTSIFELIKH